MSTIFKKNLHLCFFKIKCLPISLSPPLTLENEEDDNDNYNNYQTPTLVKKFNSIYDFTTSSSSLSTSATTSTDEYDFTPPDISTVFASQRFFVSSPGCSNSILDSSSSTSKLVGGGVPVKKDSPDPFSDFRRSMLEMIEARDNKNNKDEDENEDKDEDGDDESEWEFLRELLLCYLNLNPRNTHKFIIEAFSDVLVSRVSSAS